MLEVPLQCTRQPSLLFISAISGFVVVNTKPFAVLMVYVHMTIGCLFLRYNPMKDNTIIINAPLG